MTKTGNQMARIFTTFFFSLLCVLGAQKAQAVVSVQSSMDRSRIGIGDEFVYTVAVLSTEEVEVQNPRPPDLDGFELVQNWNSTAISQKMMATSKGMDWQTQRRHEFNYRLRAVRGGRLSIGAFDVVAGGKSYATQPLVVEVANSRQGPAQGQQGQQPPGFPPGLGFPDQDQLDAMDRAEEEMFNQLLQRRNQMFQRPEPQYRTLPINPNDAFFIQVEVDKTEVYEGEQITASWYIYTRGQMETLDRAKFPDLRGFWKEIIEEVPTIQFTEEIVNGIPYKKALLASHALFPLKVGTAVIDEYKIKSRVRVATQSLGGMVLGKAYEYTKSSKRVNIKVKPLPTEGRPASYTGAVGIFDIHAAVDNSTVLVNQPVSVRVRFEGTGNAKGIDLPAVDWPKSVEVYDTKSDSKFFKNGRSYKQFEILVIPRAEGPLEIPPIEFSYFDPAKGKYEKVTSENIHLQVVANPNAPAGSIAPSDGSTATPSPAAPTAPAVALGDRLPDPIQGFQTASTAGALFMQPIFWAAMYLGVFLALIFKGKIELGGGQRKRDLREVFDRRWKSFEKIQKEGDHRRIGVEMTNLFYLVLGGVAGDAGASEEMSRVLEKIPPSLRRDFGDEILRRMDVFQVLSFAPEEALGELKDSVRLQKEVKEAKTLLSSLVNRLSEVDHEKI